MRGHDVSGEARGYHGRWSRSGAPPPAQPVLPLTAPRTPQEEEDRAIVRTMLDRAPLAKEGPRTAHFLFGPPGSGKTTWAKAHLLNDHIVHVSSDEIKELLPGYTHAAAGEFHAWSMELADRLFARCVTRGRSLCVDATGAKLSHYSEMIRHAKQAGYKVVFHVMKTPTALAESRNAARDRSVPAGMVARRAKQAERTLAAVMPQADEVQHHG